MSKLKSFYFEDLSQSEFEHRLRYSSRTRLEPAGADQAVNEYQHKSLHIKRNLGRSIKQQELMFDFQTL